jgi:hypothetical protein
MSRYFSKKVGEIHTYIVKQGATNKETLTVEVLGKIKALRAAGLPTDLPKAQPAQSRWGKTVSIEEARSILAQ